MAAAAAAVALPLALLPSSRSSVAARSGGTAGKTRERAMAGSLSGACGRTPLPCAAGSRECTKLRPVTVTVGALPQTLAGVPLLSSVGSSSSSKRRQRQRQDVHCQAGPVDVENEEKDEASTATTQSSDKLDSRRGLEERFAVLNTGIYECSSCGYVYDQALGDKNYPIAPGMAFRDLPEDWRCPTCGAAQGYFRSKSIEVAGFAQNQSYGLGGNSLTSGQKSLLIYGTLAFFFALFLSGYFLQ